MNAKPRRMRGTEDTASCIQVMRVLQSFLDGHADEVTSRRLAKHLYACRRCGLEAATYRAIKESLARRAPQADTAVIERLRTFGATLATGPNDENGSGQSLPPA